MYHPDRDAVDIRSLHFTDLADVARDQELFAALVEHQRQEVDEALREARALGILK